jgi:hypothetical protein
LARALGTSPIARWRAASPKLWTYPWLISLPLAFIAYQLYQITAVHFSAGLTLLTVCDPILVWLTWPEYRAKRARVHPEELLTAVVASRGTGRAWPQATRMPRWFCGR